MAGENIIPAGNGVVTPPPDPDAAKYDELRKELGLNEAGDPVEPAEADVEDKGETEPEDEPSPEPRAKPEHVPYTEHENIQRALREARAAQKASDERLAGIIELVNRSRERREPEPKKDEPAKLPDVQEDPIGHFTGRIAQLEAALTKAQQGNQQTAEQFQAAQEHQQLFSLVQRSEAEILDPKSGEGHKADYWDACAHLETQRVKELDRMYPDGSPYAMHYARQQGFVDPAQLKLAILNHDRRAVAIQALQLGRPPAQVYYELAVDRGYVPKVAKVNGAGKDGIAERAKQQLEAARKGKAASLSISGGDGGRKGAEDMTLSDLADLFAEDPDMADKVWDQMERAGKLG
jgi:hypothetical protein